MFPIRLETRRFTGGFAFGIAERPDVLVADPLQMEPLIIESLSLEDPLFLRFVNCATDADFMRFLERFYDHSVVEIGELKAQADELRRAARFSIDKVLDGRALGSGDPHHANRALDGVTLKPSVRRFEGASRLVLAATSTADFMALEIAAAIEAGAQMTACQHCKKHFLFGPFTGRRSHAKYCSDRCRVAAMRVRNASKES